MIEPTESVCPECVEIDTLETVIEEISRVTKATTLFTDGQDIEQDETDRELVESEFIKLRCGSCGFETEDGRDFLPSVDEED